MSRILPLAKCGGEESTEFPADERAHKKITLRHETLLLTQEIGTS